MIYERPRYLDAGESALVVEFGDSVDPALNVLVLALESALRRAGPKGVGETVPTYRSLMIHYEPLTVTRAELVASLESLSPRESASPTAKARWRLPCCYAPELAEDIALAAHSLGMTGERLAELHAGADYRVYMYGFAPGWCYLGGLPRELALPRRDTPRGPTPQGAVLIGGGLSLVATNPMPTGWYVIGRTPERLFSLDRNPPILIEPGDAIGFDPIDARTFWALEARAASGETLARRDEAR